MLKQIIKCLSIISSGGLKMSGLTFQDLDNDPALVGEIIEFAQPGWGIEKSYFPSSAPARLAVLKLIEVKGRNPGYQVEERDLSQCGTHHIRYTVRKTS
jgi:hypothetical protein